MKKKFVGRLGVVALALTLITTCLMGGTLAKYTAQVSGSASATVAKFAFDLNGATEQTANQTISLTDLFKNTYSNGKVQGASGALVVAPGTSGSAKITLKNEGEVAIKPSFTITETNAGSIPLQYAVTTTAAAPTADADWKAADALAPDEKTVAIAGTQDFYLHWRWNTASTDAADTTLGTKTVLDSAKLDISCTVTQDI